MYFLIAFLDLILRLNWVWTLSFAVIETHFWWPEIFIFWVSLLEIIRRGIWNIIRVENEHIKVIYFNKEY